MYNVLAATSNFRIVPVYLHDLAGQLFGSSVLIIAAALSMSALGQCTVLDGGQGSMT